ncbi:MAG: choice-of-anchor tandem repeat GloVer-containing protein, partial [Candidatus Cybelea sp.]
MLDVNGTLYGTTEVGDQITSNGYGTVFSVSAAGSEHVLHSFSPSGAFPAAALISVGGLLYGTTPSYGSNNGGTVFSITTAGYLTTLHNFGSGSDGISPFAPLLYAQGTLYGT